MAPLDQRLHPAFTIALLLLLAGMLAALAGVPPTLAVLILRMAHKTTVDDAVAAVREVREDR